MEAKIVVSFLRIFKINQFMIDATAIAIFFPPIGGKKPRIVANEIVKNHSEQSGLYAKITFSGLLIKNLGNRLSLF
jgi:hypothetical protein